MPQQSNHGRSNPPPPPKRQSSSGKAKSRSKSNGRVGADGDVSGKGRSKSNGNEVTRSKTQSSTRTQEITTYNRRNTTSSSSVGDRSRSRSKSKKQNNDNGASDANISRSRSKSKTKSKKSPKQQSNTKSTTNKTTTSPSKTPRTSSTKKLQAQQPKLKKRDKKLFADNARKAIPSSIRMISGSHDTQTSADVSNISSQFQLPNPAGRSGGACTAALLNVLYHNHKYGNNDTEDDMMSWVDVLRQMRTVLQDKGFTQIPQLTSSRMIDVQHDPFVITPEDGSFHPSRNTQRAVLIGINYTGQSSGQLSGCHNDVHNVAKYLMDVQGFKEKNVTILMDDGKHKSPTKSAILSAYKRLVKESKSGDVVFCHYSGHGGRLVDDNGDEEDGYDETLIPVDFKQSGQIRDDDLLRILIHPMPAGITMTCLMDCCHSGTVLDLPYRFVADGDSTEMIINDRVNFSDAVWSGMGLALGMAAGSAVATAVASGAVAAVAEAKAAASVPQEMMILGGGPNAIHEYSDSDCCVIL